MSSTVVSFFPIRDRRSSDIPCSTHSTASNQISVVLIPLDVFGNSRVSLHTKALQKQFGNCHKKNIFKKRGLPEYHAQLSKLWWMPNSVSKGFGTAMKMGSSTRFQQPRTTQRQKYGNQCLAKFYCKNNGRNEKKYA